MSKLLEIVSRPQTGLALLTVREFGATYTGQLWEKCKARKQGVCDASGAKYKVGAEVYRPVGNSKNRSMRILASRIDIAN